MMSADQRERLMGKVMRLFVCLVLFACAFAGSIRAGEIYGTISDEGGKAMANVVVVARAADSKTEVARDTTDTKGAYRVFVKKTGTTKIVVLRDKAEIAGEAISYPNPVRYNWIFEKVNDTLTLRRQQ
jgi:hypothetical protein